MLKEISLQSGHRLIIDGPKVALRTPNGPMPLTDCAPVGQGPTAVVQYLALHPQHARVFIGNKVIGWKS